MSDKTTSGLVSSLRPAASNPASSPELTASLQASVNQKHASVIAA